MSSEMWHITNENSLEEERGAGSEMRHVTEGSLTGREEEGGMHS